MNAQLSLEVFTEAVVKTAVYYSLPDWQMSLKKKHLLCAFSYIDQDFQIAVL